MISFICSQQIISSSNQVHFIIISRVAMGAQSSSMPEQAAPAAPTQEQSGEKKKCKACCACPETKRARDDCIVSKGEENCKDLIEAHRKCMKEMGFNI